MDRDYRDDDIEALRVAIASFRGVVSVGPISADHDSYISDARALDRLRDKVWAVLSEESR